MLLTKLNVYQSDSDIKQNLPSEPIFLHFIIQEPFSPTKCGPKSTTESTLAKPNRLRLLLFSSAKKCLVVTSVKLFLGHFSITFLSFQYTL